MSTTNGTCAPPAPPPHPREVRRHLQEQLARAIMGGQNKRARRLMESLMLWDDFGGSDLLDPLRPSSNDGPGWVRLAPPSVPYDRAHGARWPVWRTQPELDILRQESRLRVAANPHVQGALKNLVNNVIGKGFAYTAVPITPKGEEPEEGKEELAKKVQEVIDKFLRLNNWNGGTHPNTSGVVVATREREIYRRVKGEDGECFLRFHFQPDGETLVRYIEPELVRDLGGTFQEGWSYGIRHQMEPFEDVETALEYRVFWPDPAATGGEGDNNGLPEDIPAEEVLHIKGPDTPATVKRGLSAFLFDCGRAFDRAVRLQRNASLGAAYRAATGEIWQHQVGTQAQITALASGLGEGQSVSDPETGGLFTVEKIRAPAIRRVPATQEYVPLPPDQSESYLAAGQGDLRQAGSALAIPEFWMAETSSGNYSNLESAAAPAVRDGQTEQEYYKAAYAAAVWKAIMWAVECGRLPPGVEDEIKLEVEAPAVLHRNELERAQEDQIGVENGWKDRQTCAEERGLDWQQVNKRNEEFDQQRQDAMLQQQAAQVKMMGGPPGAGGNGKPPGPGGGGPPKPPEGQPPKPALPQRTGGQVRESGEGHDVSGEKRDDSGKWTSGGGGGEQPAHEFIASAYERSATLDDDEYERALAAIGAAGKEVLLAAAKGMGYRVAPGTSAVKLRVALQQRLESRRGASKRAGDHIINRKVGKEDEPWEGERPTFRQGDDAVPKVQLPGRTGGQVRESGEGHDVSSEPRDESGEWTAGGGGSAAADGDREPRHKLPHEDVHFGYKFTSPSGDEFHVLASRDGGRKDSWEVFFAGSANDLTVTGKEGAGALGVMRNVRRGLEKFVEEKRPQSLYFSAKGKKSSARVKLYDRGAAAVAEKHGYSVSRNWRPGRGYRWTLTKTAAPVRESGGHDVSGEKRDESGEWTSGGGGGKRPAGGDNEGVKLSQEDREVIAEAGLNEGQFHALKAALRPAKLEDLKGPTIDLWHGTSLPVAKKIAAKPRFRGGPRGANATADIDHAAEYPEDTGADALVLLRAKTDQLDVDPNDQVGETVAEGLFPEEHGLSGRSSCAVGDVDVLAVLDMRTGVSREKAFAALKSGDLLQAVYEGITALYVGPLKGD